MRSFVIALALIGAWWIAGAAAQDYPKDQFERVQQCVSDPSCSVEKEDRIGGPVAEAEGLTYARGVCIMGCMTVCTKDDCWCEIDDKCKR
jgi:hypothetical protein